MKIFIDKNVILDVLCAREKFYDDSLQILKLCETKIIKGYISALSIANIIYVMRKELNNEKIQDIVLTISSILTIVDLSKNDIYNAILLNFNDFEDAIQAAQMKKIKGDYLITRNLKDYVNSDLKIFSPKDFINYFYQQNIKLI